MATWDLGTATGEDLDRLALAYGVRRNPEQTDQSLRAATYEYDGVTLTVGGNEVIRAGDMIALDARGQAVLAARARGTLTLDTSRSLLGRGSEDAIRAAILGGIPSSEGDAALGAAWERARGASGIIADDQRDAVDELWRAITALSSSQAVVIPLSVGSRGRMARDAWERRLCASIDAAARKTPITAAELRARRFSRPLPRRRTRDGRLGPQAYAYEDPLPLP